MATYTIVIHFNVVKRLHLRFGDIAKRTAFEQFRFVARKQALGKRVVVGLARSAHTLRIAVGFQQLPELCIHVLPAAITVHDQAPRRALPHDRLAPRADHQLRRHLGGDLPADDLARVQVQPGRLRRPTDRYAAAGR